MATINKDEEKLNLTEGTEQSITKDTEDLSDVAGTKQESENKSLKEKSKSIPDENDTISMVSDEPKENQIVKDQKDIKEIEELVSIPVIIEEMPAIVSGTEGSQSEDIIVELGEWEEQIESGGTSVADVSAETISVKKNGVVKEKAGEDLHVGQPREIEGPASGNGESEKSSTDANISGENIITEELGEETEAEVSESIHDEYRNVSTEGDDSEENLFTGDPEKRVEVEEPESIPDEKDEALLTTALVEEADKEEELESIIDEGNLATNEADKPVENLPLDGLGDENQVEEPGSAVVNFEDEALIEAHENAKKEDGKEKLMVEMDVEMDTEHNQTKSIKENVENVINEGESVSTSGDDNNTESDEPLLSENENSDGIKNQPAPPEKTFFQSIFNYGVLTPNKKPLIIAIFLGVLALIGAVATGLYTINLKEQIDSLRNQVKKTTTVVTTQVKSKSDDLDKLNNSISEIKARFEEYNQTLKNSVEQWVAVQARIEQLDQSIKSVNISKAISPPSSNIIKNEAFPFTKKGDWIVNLESTNEKDADNAFEKYRSKGMPVEKVSIKKGGRTWHRLKITGFLSAEEAKGYIKTTENREGFPYAWIERKQ